MLNKKKIVNKTSSPPPLSQTFSSHPPTPPPLSMSVLDLNLDSAGTIIIMWWPEKISHMSDNFGCEDIEHVDVLDNAQHVTV